MRTYPVEARRHNARRANVPLTDSQLQAFVANGFLTLKSSLPETYHRLIFERFDEVATGIGHFGNNLLPLIPELVEFFDDPVVKGALTSVLGRDYSMHPHRALHKNPPGSDEQQFHKDSYWGYTRRVRNHRPWWVMIMYFPQDTALEKGPTAVMAGSQHLNQRPEDYCHEVPIAGDAGSFVLIHYDIWHRKMKNLTDLNRYMFKFEFARLAPPGARNGSRPWQRPASAPTPDLSPAWRATWDWLNGQEPVPAPHQAHVEELGADDEAIGINAGYALGCDPANTTCAARSSRQQSRRARKRAPVLGQWTDLARGCRGPQRRPRACADRGLRGARTARRASRGYGARTQACGVRARRNRHDNRAPGTLRCARRRRRACPHRRRRGLGAGHSFPRHLRCACRGDAGRSSFRSALRRRTVAGARRRPRRLGA